jgi:hypothetical protein
MAKDINSPREFGEKLAVSLSKYLPDRGTALRQMAVTGLLSSAFSGGRSYLDPGYDETFDEEGRIISRKRRNPMTSALRSAGIGLGMGALSSLASQVGNNWAKDQGFWRPKT